jgi:hypothetical protein
LDGTVDYAAELDAILDGRSTTDLLVRGSTIAVDATALTVSELEFPIGAYPPLKPATAEPFALTLLPGIHLMQYAAGLGPGGSGTDKGFAYFTVLKDGTVDHDVELDQILDGRGTTDLLVGGAGIYLDARGLGESSFDLPDIGTFDATVVQLGVFLPGLHRFQTPSVVLHFRVLPSVTVDYDPSYDDLVSGRGTDRLWIGTLEPSAAIAALLADVMALELRIGLERSLSSKLEAALASVGRDAPATLEQMLAFIHEVEALRGTKLTDMQAEALIGAAERVIEALEGA